MHVNEGEPQGTNISLQTYMHIESKRMGEKGKDIKTEIKRDKKVSKMVKARCRDRKEGAEKRL